MRLSVTDSPPKTSRMSDAATALCHARLCGASMQRRHCGGSRATSSRYRSLITSPDASPSPPKTKMASSDGRPSTTAECAQRGVGASPVGSSLRHSHSSSASAAPNAKLVVSALPLAAAAARPAGLCPHSRGRSPVSGSTGGEPGSSGCSVVDGPAAADVSACVAAAAAANFDPAASSEVSLDAFCEPLSHVACLRSAAGGGTSAPESPSSSSKPPPLRKMAGRWRWESRSVRSTSSAAASSASIASSSQRARLLRLCGAVGLPSGDWVGDTADSTCGDTTTVPL